MSYTPTEQSREQNTDRDGEPLVPAGVLRGLQDLENGETADKEDIESVLKF